MAKLKNIHPGEIFSEEFMMHFGIWAYKPAKDIGIPQTRVSEILKGNRKITADTALRFGKYFGTSAKFWLGLQDNFEQKTNVKGNLIECNPTIRYNAG